MDLRETIRRLGRSFPILVIEDDPRGIEVVSEILRSPLWDPRVVGSYRELAALPRRASPKWTCIIADVNLESPDGKTGIDALSLFPHFPCKITLSGLGSLETGARATREGGAREVLDKGGPGMPLRLAITVAKFAALGRMLTEGCPDHADVLFILIDHPPGTVQDWADRSFMVRRRLEQICSQMLGCSPKDAISLHRALTYLQLKASPMPGMEEAASGIALAPGWEPAVLRRFGSADVAALP